MRSEPSALLAAEEDIAALIDMDLGRVAVATRSDGDDELLVSPTVDGLGRESLSALGDGGVSRGDSNAYCPLYCLLDALGYTFPLAGNDDGLEDLFAVTAVEIVGDDSVPESALFAVHHEPTFSCVVSICK